jgi:RNA polymerase sigma-70 factor, ECF subfamily
VTPDALLEYLPDLVAFARSLTRDRAEADDLVQDTMVRALASRDTFRGESSPRTWLHRIMVHQAIDHHRRSSRVSVGELDPEQVEARWRDDTYTVDPEVMATRVELRTEVEDALVRLPFHYRSAVVLHDMVGWTAAAIADEFGIALPAAKQRIRRGRMLLITALAEGAERRRALKGVPMRCWDARELVSDYLDDQLAGEQRALLEAHLHECPTCPPLYAALVGTRAALGRLRDADTVVPPELETRIRSTLGA